MNRQLSPFAALSGAEKQIRWLEYQSIRLPYVEVEAAETEPTLVSAKNEPEPSTIEESTKTKCERPIPPPEVPRSFSTDYNRTRHTQYDAVIARMKQAELQSRRSGIYSSQ